MKSKKKTEPQQDVPMVQPKAPKMKQPKPPKAKQPKEPKPPKVKEPKPPKVKEPKPPKERKRRDDSSPHAPLNEQTGPPSAIRNQNLGPPSVRVNRRKTPNPVLHNATKMLKGIKGELNDGGKCVKFMLLFYNVFVLLAGGAVLGTAVWIAVNRAHISMITGNMLFTVATYITVAGGAVMIIMAVMGSCAALCQSRGMLLLYALMSVLVIVVLITGGIIAVVYPTKLDDRNRDEMLRFIREQYGVHMYLDYNRVMTEAWDKAQDELHCCAVTDNNWSIYRGSEWYNRQAGIEGVSKPYVPQTCCLREYPSGEYRSLQLCQTWRYGPPGEDSGENWSLYGRGCLAASNEYIQGHIQILLGLGIGFGLSLILGIVLAISLFRQLNPKAQNGPA